MTEPEGWKTTPSDESRHVRIWTAMQLLVLAGILVLAGWLLRQGYRRYTEAVYPLQYTAIVNRAATEYGFEPSLIFAVIHTESGFDCHAVSRADAKGLMQLTDATFEWAQQRAGTQPLLPPALLFEPETNIHYGTFVLYLLSQQFTSLDTALAAYNAGQGRVKGCWMILGIPTTGSRCGRFPIPKG